MHASLQQERRDIGIGLAVHGEDPVGVIGCRFSETAFEARLVDVVVGPPQGGVVERDADDHRHVLRDRRGVGMEGVARHRVAVDHRCEADHRRSGAATALCAATSFSNGTSCSFET